MRLRRGRGSGLGWGWCWNGDADGNGYGCGFMMVIWVFLGAWGVRDRADVDGFAVYVFVLAPMTLSAWAIYETNMRG